MLAPGVVQLWRVMYKFIKRPTAARARREKRRERRLRLRQHVVIAYFIDMRGPFERRKEWAAVVSAIRSVCFCLVRKWQPVCSEIWQ